MDEGTEGDIIEALRDEAAMLDPMSLASEFKSIIKDVARLKPVLNVVGRIYEV